MISARWYEPPRSRPADQLDRRLHLLGPDVLVRPNWIAREQGRAVVDRDRGFDGDRSRRDGDFAAPPATEDEGHHQDGSVADIPQAAGASGRQQFYQRIAGDSFGTLALRGL